MLHRVNPDIALTALGNGSKPPVQLGRNDGEHTDSEKAFTQFLAEQGEGDSLIPTPELRFVEAATPQKPVPEAGETLVNPQEPEQAMQTSKSAVVLPVPGMPALAATRVRILDVAPNAPVAMPTGAAVFSAVVDDNMVGKTLPAEHTEPAIEVPDYPVENAPAAANQWPVQSAHSALQLVPSAPTSVAEALSKPVPPILDKQAQRAQPVARDGPPNARPLGATIQPASLHQPHAKAFGIQSIPASDPNLGAPSVQNISTPAAPASVTAPMAGAVLNAPRPAEPAPVAMPLRRGASTSPFAAKPPALASTTPTQAKALTYLEALAVPSALSAASQSGPIGVSGVDDALAALTQSATTTAHSTTAAAPILASAGTYAPRVAAQIAAAVVHSSSGTTEIALNPQELGRVRMTLTNTEAGLAIAILAERPETADLMRKNINLLVREFQDLGHDNLSFSFGDHPAGSDQSNEDHNGPPATLGDIDTFDDATPIYVTTAHTGGLDLKL